MKRTRYFFKKLFYEIIHPIIKFYGFLFRPNTKGVKCAIDFKGKILFVRLNYAHRGWTLPGGGVKRNESFEEAIRRETMEEVGVNLEKVEKIGEYKAVVEYKNDNVVCFYSKVSKPDFKVDGFEIAEAKWCDPDLIPEPYSIRVPLIVGFLKSKFK
jgi:8-oxo-dGTP pyrophosphatase MutT (NUDIX family)